jgi:hypothetical protein
MAIISLFALVFDITWDWSQILPYRSAKSASQGEFGCRLTEKAPQPLTAPFRPREIIKELI